MRTRKGGAAPVDETGRATQPRWVFAGWKELLAGAWPAGWPLRCWCSCFRGER
jgi:hypothetical protein